MQDRSCRLTLAGIGQNSIKEAAERRNACKFQWKLLQRNRDKNVLAIKKQCARHVPAHLFWGGHGQDRAAALHAEGGGVAMPQRADQAALAQARPALCRKGRMQTYPKNESARAAATAAQGRRACPSIFRPFYESPLSAKPIKNFPIK